MQGSDHTPYRLADVLSGLSLISDLGFGLPVGEAMRSCLLGTALARKLDLPEEQVRDTFFTALMLHIGCVSMSHETAALFGNELNVTRAVSMTDLADPEDYEATLIPEIMRETEASQRERVSLAIITSGPSFGRLYDTASGEVGGETARRIGLPVGTQRALAETGESWAGGAGPKGLEGDEITLPARIVRLCADAAFFADIGSADLAVQAVKKRAGGTLDPELADRFVAHAPELLEEAAAHDPRARVLEVEPTPVRELGPDDLLTVATAFGDAGDLKTPYMHGHSAAVTSLATAAAERAGLPTDDVERLRIAALLHDVGRVGISDVIWEKAGPLSLPEWELVRMHPYHSERILATSQTLEPMARIAGMHRERPDGTGYHRGSSRNETPAAARLLGAADAFVAMTQERPHRSPLPEEKAAEQLREGARSGTFDADAVDAVLAAAGRGTSGRAGVRPAGLSEREVEVLKLVARGCSNPEVAETLHVSRRTAEHHVQHIYSKIGVSTRPGAALFAVQHGLVE